LDSEEEGEECEFTEGEEDDVEQNPCTVMMLQAKEVELYLIGPSFPIRENQSWVKGKKA